MAIVDKVFDLFQNQGGSAYFGERVSQQEHALQSAWLAEQEQAPAALIVAALLHDIGHLLHSGPEDIADKGIDTRHEAIGARWLERHGFGPEVIEPIRLHVAAKRYLCSIDQDYFAALSAASVKSFYLQGGLLNAEQVRAFEQSPYAQDAARVRRYDDRAKIIGLRTPDLAHYRFYLLSVT